MYLIVICLMLVSGKNVLLKFITPLMYVHFCAITFHAKMPIYQMHKFCRNIKYQFTAKHDWCLQTCNVITKKTELRLLMITHWGQLWMQDTSAYNINSIWYNVRTFKSWPTPYKINRQTQEIRQEKEWKYFPLCSENVDDLYSLYCV